ncbi:MAG: phage Gp37/Gp68 family protein [Erysipelotrichales bacterium]|nr:phage Gp37/Gp68 family protein [Erysipelotrichales bacterium]
MEVMWNLWHGCKRISPGCKNCYVFRSDARRNLDANNFYITKSFELPLQRKKDGQYKYPSGTLFWTCFSSDFFLEVADSYREKAWSIIKERSDCHFFFITKRILRFWQCIPDDWENGYENVTIGVTCETQKLVDERLIFFNKLPVHYKAIILEPLLESVDLSHYLKNGYRAVVAGGESGEGARIADFEWFKALQKQCLEAKVTFIFKQTGLNFIKDGKIYRIPRPHQHRQARKAGLNVHFNDYWKTGK